MTGIFSSILGQEIAENKIDEFTKDSVKRTSYEALNNSSNFTASFRISKINGTEYFDLKIMLGGSVFSIGKGQKLMFKLYNDSIVELSNIEYSLSRKGCGAKGFIGSAAEGVKTSYLLGKNEHAIFAEHKIIKLRVYTTNGYVENDIKEKNALTLQKALKLIE